jgi:hypothetical protein
MIGDVNQSSTEPILLMYAPYLPLRERIDVNGWALVPVAELDQAEAVSDFAQTAAAGLARLYSRDDDAVTGAFVYPVGEGIGGGQFDGADVLNMHRALVVIALDGNPSPRGSDEERDGNAAFRAMTSDNALVYGQPVRGDGYVAAEYGAMITTLSGGYNVLADHLEPPMRIRPPADLWMPSSRVRVDGDLADAVHRVITADSDEARRLNRAIGWLDLAWRNADSITVDLRIPAVRSGFEVLFDTDDTVVARQRLSCLLDPADAPRSSRTWQTLRGKPKQAYLSDLEWWWMQFTFLRNAIAHGGALEPERYQHDGHYHLDLGLHRLKEAIKTKVIASGFPELELDPGARALNRAMRKHGLAPPDETDESATSAPVGDDA